LYASLATTQARRSLMAIGLEGGVVLAQSVNTNAGDGVADPV
jgi:hypothetical protein